QGSTNGSAPWTAISTGTTVLAADWAMWTSIFQIQWRMTMMGFLSLRPGTLGWNTILTSPYCFPWILDRKWAWWAMAGSTMALILTLPSGSVTNSRFSRPFRGSCHWSKKCTAAFFLTWGMNILAA